MPLSERALCTTQDVVDELGGVEDPRFLEWIEDASESIASFLGRPIHRQAAIVEKHIGNGSPFMILSRAPIIEINSIAFDGAEVASTNYEVHDVDAGVVYFVGAPTLSTGYLASQIDTHVVPGTERKTYTVTYEAGWITPGQAALAGGDYEGLDVTLPRAIRRACVTLVVQAYHDAGRDHRLASESLMSHSVSYRSDDDDADAHGIPKAVRSRLAPYRFEDGAA